MRSSTTVALIGRERGAGNLELDLCLNIIDALILEFVVEFVPIILTRNGGRSRAEGR